MPLRFTLRQLEYFVAVGETASIALASERLHVSSPSISAAISQLEAEFGLPLFVRHHARGLSLTQAGRQLLDRARNILAEAEALGRAAGQISGRVQGPLALGGLQTFAQVLLPQLRRGFEGRYPEVSMTLCEAHQQDIFDAIRRGAIDLALTYDMEIPEDLQFVPLVGLPPHVLLPEGHALASRAALTVADLADHPMVLLDLPLSSEYFLSLFRAAGVRPRIAERTRDMGVMRSLVANGFGYSIANFRPLNDLAPDGRRLVILPLDSPAPPIMLGLVMARGAEAVLTVAAFVDHCRATITPGGVPGMNMPPVP